MSDFFAQLEGYFPELSENLKCTHLEFNHTRSYLFLTTCLITLVTLMIIFFKCAKSKNVENKNSEQTEQIEPKLDSYNNDAVNDDSMDVDDISKHERDTQDDQTQKTPDTDPQPRRSTRKRKPRVF